MSLSNSLFYIDYNSILKEAATNTKENIGRIISILAGNYSKSKLYGNVPLSDVELLHLYRYVSNAKFDSIMDVESIVDKSIQVSKHLKVVILNPEIRLRPEKDPKKHIIIRYNNSGDQVISLIITDINNFKDKDIISALSSYSSCNALRCLFNAGIDFSVPKWPNTVEQLFMIRYCKAIIYPIASSMELKKDEIQIIPSILLGTNEEFIELMIEYINKFGSRDDLEYESSLIIALYYRKNKE